MVVLDITDFPSPWVQLEVNKLLSQSDHVCTCQILDLQVNCFVLFFFSIFSFTWTQEAVWPCDPIFFS